MLWVDKHRPHKLEDLSYHSEITQRLGSLATNPDSMPHLFVYGPSGSGKKTRIAALLRELYGPGADKLKLDKRTFTTPTKRTVEVNMVTSSYHIELSPGDAGLNDRFVVQDVIKEMASNKNIATAGVSGGNDSSKPSGKKAAFKTVVLMEVDRLSRQAQAALRRTMEKYASSCRLILCCNSQSKVIEPVRSRCLGIRVAAPTEDQVGTIGLYYYVLVILESASSFLLFLQSFYFHRSAQSFNKIEQEAEMVLLWDKTVVAIPFMYN